METMGGRAKARRQEFKLSQAEVAKRVSKILKETVHQQSIAQVENDEVDSPRFLPELAKVLSLNHDWLKYGEDGKELAEQKDKSSYKADRRELYDLIDKLPAANDVLQWVELFLRAVLTSPMVKAANRVKK